MGRLELGRPQSAAAVTAGARGCQSTRTEALTGQWSASKAEYSYEQLSLTGLLEEEEETPSMTLREEERAAFSSFSFSEVSLVLSLWPPILKNFSLAFSLPM